MWNRNAVESPDSAQPKPSQAGSCSSVPLRSCSLARKVLAPVGAATLGEAVGVLAAAVELAGAAEAVMEVPEVLTGPVVPVVEEAAELVEEAAELVEELQAVNRTATHAREAQDATCRGLRALPTWLPRAAGLAWPPAAAGLAWPLLAAGVICMVPTLQSMSERLGEVRHIFDAERPGWVGKPLHRARTAAVRA